MALSPLIQYEVRSTSTANNVNGGGFKAGASGTDYSQQDAAQWTATDGTSNASTTFTSATGGFTAAIIGNVLHLTAGTNGTPDWYEVTGYTDANTITLDRNCSTGAMTNGTYYVGGAMSLNSTLDDDFFEIMVGTNGTGGNKIWVKAGSYTLSEGVLITAAGGTQAPIVVEGYNATRGDAPSGANRPTIACGANNFTLGANWDIYNTSFTGTNLAYFGIGNSSKVVNCKFTNLSTTAGRYAFYNSQPNTLVLNCEMISYRGQGINHSSNASGFYIGNYIHDSDIGIQIENTVTYAPHLINNIIESCIAKAINYSGAMSSYSQLHGNTLYGSENTTGTGVSIATGVQDLRAINNIIYGFATGVSHADTQTVGFDNYNCYNNNDTDVTSWTKGANDVTTAPGFSSVAQVTGTAGAFVAGGSKLVDTSKNFTTLGVVASDCVYIVSGTGVTAGIYLIDSISTTTNPNDTLNITVPASPGTNTTADKTYQITTGHNFAITGSI